MSGTATKKAVDRPALLEHLARLATDADAVEEARRVFLPLPSHRLALRPEIVVIEGLRGAGKTSLFHVLNALGDEVPTFFDDPSVPAARWVDAFSEARGHPSPAELDALVAGLAASHDARLRAFWVVHLLTRLEQAGGLGARVPEPIAGARAAHPHDLAAWLPVAERNIGAAIAALEALDDALEQQRRFVFASYDHLDRLGLLAADRATRQRLVRALLAFWLSASTRLRRLRAKVFLRPDLFEEAERSFPDASKLRPRAVSLDWSVEHLYRLAVRHLANRGPHVETMRDWLTAKARVELEEHRDFGVLPGPMPEARQRALATALAGEVMGKGARKGYTHRWIPARLRDAGGRIVPRSFLRLLGYAAQHAQRDPPGQGPLMEPTSLVGALGDASRARVNELREEYPLVARLEHLRGNILLLARPKVVAALERGPIGGDDGLGRDGGAVFEELQRIGVVEVRDDGRVDVPDLYRYGYGIKRKGGAKAPR
ncbi:MAG: hypothetical protein KF729_10195 [Sandaracinaceae bacterium]|nr:hypothetical protein [Sandaracinaceae bacterium]